MIKIRKFSDVGIDIVKREIESNLTEMKKGLHGIPIGEVELERIMLLAHDESLLESCSSLIFIDSTKEFASSFELGKYLYKQFENNNFDGSDFGLWSWLAIIYLKQLLKRNKDGAPLLGSSYRYILDNDNRIRYYRHLIFMPYYLMQRLGEHSYIFLHSPLYYSGEFLGVAQKDDVLSNKNLVAMCRKYFFNEGSGHFSPGFTADNYDPRSLRRLVQSIVPQLKVNFDIRYSSPDMIFDLLPSDFKMYSFLSND